MTAYKQAALTDLSAEEFLEVLENASPEQLQALANIGQQARLTSAFLPNWLSQSFACPRRHANIWSIISWWERRRLSYNLLVGTSGLVALLILALGFQADWWLLINGTIAFGVAANLCYCLGAPAEIIAWFYWREKADQLGPILLSLGMIFSTALTLGVAALLAVAALIF